MVYNTTMKNQQAGNIRRAQASLAAWEGRKAELMQWYLIDKLSQAEIATLCAVTPSALQKILIRLGIPSRGRGRKGSENGRFIHGMESTLYRKMVDKTHCARCGAIDNLCVHHVDCNHFNNDVGNLEVLCMSCHSSHHKADYWRKQQKMAI